MTDQWLEISLIVDGELAEAVAEVLARFSPEGVVIESTLIDPNGSQEGTVVGPLRVAAYLPVDAQLEATRQKLEEALWYLGRIRPLPNPQYKKIEQTDWSQAWKGHYQPIAIGQRLAIVPAWLENPWLERIPIRIDPGMAFGTGTHPTTQMCLEMIEEYFLTAIPYSASSPKIGKGREQSTGMVREEFTLIDVGCGSGILSIAALKLGAAHALGVDVDELAVKNAGENARTNGVAQALELGVGSVKEIRQGMFSQQKAPLVVANILAPIIIQLFDEGLGELVLPQGSLILSGILADQAGSVLAAGEKKGLRLTNKKVQGDWVGLRLQFTAESPAAS